MANGLERLAAAVGAAPDDWVLVHDAARPCLHPEDLAALIDAGLRHPTGALLAAPVRDTLKRARPDDASGSAVVDATVSRDGMWRALTPQMFRVADLAAALAEASGRGAAVTDDSEAIEVWAARRGRPPPQLVEARFENPKVTASADLEAAGRYLASRTEGMGVSLRIGQGYDAHRFGPGDGLVVGGEHITFNRGVVAHSDGDVLLHAVCDALLGAAGLGDLGAWFPDSDPRYASASSRILLREVRERVAEAGWRAVNVDATVIAEAPRLAGHRDAMRANLAADLGLPVEAASVKATTTEGMGFVGRGEGIACHAVALLEPIPES